MNARIPLLAIATEIDGSSAHITESALIGKLLNTHKPGDKVKASVLRAGKRIELSLAMQ